MFCPKCDKESNDGVKFCTFCGSALPADQEANREPSDQTSSSPIEETALDVSFKPAELIKKLLLSRTFLVAIVAYSAYVLFSFLKSLASPFLLPRFSYFSVYDIFNNGFLSGISNITGSPVYASPIGTLIGLIPAILVVVGGWMLYASARKTQAELLNPMGLKIISITPIIFLVMIYFASVIFFLAAFVASIMGLASAASFGDSSAATFGSGITFLLLLSMVVAVAIFFIVYGTKCVSTVNALKIAVETNTVEGTISRIVVVMCFILCAINAYGAFSSIISEISNAIVWNKQFDLEYKISWYNTITSSLISASSAVSLFCFGLLLSRYKKQLSAIFTATN